MRGFAIMTAPNWKDPATVAKLKALVAGGKHTYLQMAVEMDCTLGTLAGGIQRYLRGKKTPSDPPTQVRAHSAWDEGRLTETWADYHARKVAERAAAREMRIAA